MRELSKVSNLIKRYPSDSNNSVKNMLRTPSVTIKHINDTLIC